MCINEIYDWYFFIFFITKKLAGATLLINPYSNYTTSTFFAKSASLLKKWSKIEPFTIHRTMFVQKHPNECSNELHYTLKLTFPHFVINKHNATLIIRKTLLKGIFNIIYKK